MSDAIQAWTKTAKAKTKAFFAKAKNIQKS